jgi:hypothetical protein
MGYATELGLAEFCDDKPTRLEIHLQGNFYPRHPKEVEESTVKGFKLYWDYKIDIKKLAEYCYAKDVDVLLKYYSTFLNDEDLED